MKFCAVSLVMQKDSSGLLWRFFFFKSELEVNETAPKSLHPDRLGCDITRILTEPYAVYFYTLINLLIP